MARLLACSLSEERDLVRDKMTPPQKRRRRLMRQAVRESIAATSRLCDNVPFVVPKSDPLDQRGDPKVTSEHVHARCDATSQLLALESKVDQVLMLVSTLWSNSCHFGGMAESCQPASEQVPNLLQCFSPETPEFIPSNVSEARATASANAPPLLDAFWRNPVPRCTQTARFLGTSV